MKKRTKASQKRLNNLLMILLLTAVLLIMSTYAWFTANRTVNIDKIDVKVATQSGLQISADGITWKTVLEYKDIKDAYTTYPTSINQLPALMAPVSTALTETDGKLEMFFGDVNTDLDATSPTYGKYLLTSTIQTDKDTYRNNLLDDENEYAAGYYIAFDVFLKDTIAADALYMSGSVKETGTTIKGLENAARVALIRGGTTENVDDSAEIQALSTSGGDVMMWEPNADCHTEKGIASGLSLGWIPSGLAQTGADTLEYSGTNQEFDVGIELSQATADNSTNFTKITTTDTGAAAIWSTKKSETPSLSIPDGLTAGATKYRIYLWVEGQDIDCENNASGTDVEFNLSFSLDPFSGTSSDGGTTTDPDDSTDTGG